MHSELPFQCSVAVVCMAHTDSTMVVFYNVLLLLFCYSTSIQVWFVSLKAHVCIVVSLQ